MRFIQPTLPLRELKARLVHGGEINKGKRKERRPVVTKRPMHVVFRSTRAKGKLNLLRGRNAGFVKLELFKWSRRFEVRIYQWANVGNHIHLLVLAKTRKGFHSFMRAVPGKIAQKVTGAKRGQKFGRFWDLLAYTRIVEWGKGFRAVRNYIFRNELEAAGSIPYRARNLGVP